MPPNPSRAGFDSRAPARPESQRAFSYTYTFIHMYSDGSFGCAQDRRRPPHSLIQNALCIHIYVYPYTNHFRVRAHYRHLGFATLKRKENFGSEVRCKRKAAEELDLAPLALR